MSGHPRAMLTKRRTVLVGGVVIAAALFYACLKSGNSITDGGGLDGGTDTESGDGSRPDGTPLDGISDEDDVSSSDLGEVGDELMEGASDASDVDGGEYCPNPLFPPRTDGCSCNPPEVFCKESELGKVCDYYPYCPSGPAARYTCMWLYPSETGLISETGAKYPGWSPHGIACPGG